MSEKITEYNLILQVFYTHLTFITESRLLRPYIVGILMYIMYI